MSPLSHLLTVLFSDSDNDSGCVSVFLAARVAIEETVETKKVEMREELPTKGTTDLNIFLLQLSAVSCKTRKLTCPFSATKIFDCLVPLCVFIPFLSCSIFYFCFRQSHYIFYCSCLFCLIIFCFASRLRLQIHSISVVFLTQSVSFKFPKLRKSLKRSQEQPLRNLHRPKVPAYLPDDECICKWYIHL